MKALIILLLLANMSFAATTEVTITVDVPKATEYVNYYSDNPGATAQQKLDWLKTEILNLLKEKYKAMKARQERETNQVTYEADADSAFTGG